MMSPEPEHVCPVKCDGNGNKCPGLDTGRRCRSVEVTRTLSVQIADPPPVTYDQHSHHRHTTPVQEVNQSSSTPFPGHCTGVPCPICPTGGVSPGMSLAYASLTGSSETEDKTQSYDSQHPAHLLSPAGGNILQSLLIFPFLLYLKHL